MITLIPYLHFDVPQVLMTIPPLFINQKKKNIDTRIIFCHYYEVNKDAP